MFVSGPASVLADAASAPVWGQSFLLKIIPFIIVLGLLIFCHELGHFLAAKAFGVKVIRFSFGLGPRLVGFKWGETDYCVSAFPRVGSSRWSAKGPRRRFQRKNRSAPSPKNRSGSESSLFSADPSLISSSP